MFDHEVITAARMHAIEEFPREACGVVAGGVYHPCTNIHPEPEKHFRIHQNRMIGIAKKSPIQAIIHSHPYGPVFPSEADMKGQIDSGVPWGIVVTQPGNASNPVWFGEGAPIKPYLGRMFVHGVSDCYQLLKDYYAKELNIKLFDVPREDDWWVKPGHGDFYLNHYKANGFVEIPIEQLAKHDVILMSICSQVANHCAICLGGDTAMHHLAGRYSEEFTGIMRWKKHIKGVYRHKNLMETPDEA